MEQHFLKDEDIGPFPEERYQKFVKKLSKKHAEEKFKNVLVWIIFLLVFFLLITSAIQKGLNWYLAGIATSAAIWLLNKYYISKP